MRILLDKRMLVLSLVIYALFIVIVVGIFSPRKARLWEFIVPISIPSFLSIVYFIQMVNSRKKMILLCLILPFSNCIIINLSTYFMIRILKWKMPYGGVVEIANTLMFHFFIGCVSSLIISIPLMLICFSGSFFSKNTEYENAEHSLLLFKHKQITLSVLIIFIVFIPIFSLAFRGNFGNNDIFLASVSICILSFQSIFFISPHKLMKMWKTIFYCVLIPTLWSFFVYSIYVAMSFIFIWNTPIWDEWGSYFGRDFYSINSYFDYLFKSRAWFISLPLIFLCLAYCRFSKPALPKPKTTD